MTRSFLRRVLNTWIAWRNAKQIRKAIPAIAELDRQEAEYRRAHKRGSARIIKARKQAVCAALAGRRVSGEA
ncbi:MAG: hypothetical protein WC047_05225 [Kiritimatiellales bacterium]